MAEQLQAIFEYLEQGNLERDFELNGFKALLAVLGSIFALALVLSVCSFIIRRKYDGDYPETFLERFIAWIGEKWTDHKEARELDRKILVLQALEGKIVSADEIRKIFSYADAETPCAERIALNNTSLWLRDWLPDYVLKQKENTINGSFFFSYRKYFVFDGKVYPVSSSQHVIMTKEEYAQDKEARAAYQKKKAEQKQRLEKLRELKQKQDEQEYRNLVQDIYDAEKINAAEIPESFASMSVDEKLAFLDALHEEQKDTPIQLSVQTSFPEFIMREEEHN